VPAPNWNSVVLAMHMDSSGFIDEKGAVITNNSSYAFSSAG
jgi:hypothetical protein